MATSSAYNASARASPAMLPRYAPIIGPTPGIGTKAPTAPPKAVPKNDTISRFLSFMLSSGAAVSPKSFVPAITSPLGVVTV